MYYKIYLVIFIPILWGCQAVPPPEKPPAGDGWITYQQAGSAIVAASATVRTENTTVNYTTVEGSVQTFNGTFLNSKEKPQCKGYGWVQDCNSLFFRNRK